MACEDSGTDHNERVPLLNAEPPLCGRFTLTTDATELVNHFGLEQQPTLTPRYNIAPSQQVAVIAPKSDPSKRGLAFLKWGLVPYWSKDGKPGPINARAETVGRLPTFSDSFRHKRCIIPTSGFYEWRVEGSKKRPHHFRLATGGVMGFAGLWSVWGEEGTKRLFTCCIITTTANEVVKPFHDRMPAILSPDDYEEWFDPDGELRELHALETALCGVDDREPCEHAGQQPQERGPQLLDPAA